MKSNILQHFPPLCLCSSLSLYLELSLYSHSYQLKSQPLLLGCYEYSDQHWFDATSWTLIVRCILFCMHSLNYSGGRNFHQNNCTTSLGSKSHQCLNCIWSDLKPTICSRVAGIKYELNKYIQIKYYLKPFFKNKPQQSESEFYSGKIFVFFVAR